VNLDFIAQRLEAFQQSFGRGAEDGFIQMIFFLDFSVVVSELNDPHGVTFPTSARERGFSPRTKNHSVSK
jgi:hypothetical protein